MSDVNELANKYLEEYDNEDKPKNIARDAFICAYQKAREDLLSQVMSDYETQWEDYSIGLITDLTAHRNTSRYFWHQAGLSSLKEIERLKSQITEKEALLVEAKEMAEFYGDNNTWHCSGDMCYGDQVSYDDLEENSPITKRRFVGGKKAREFLAKLKTGGE